MRLIFILIIIFFLFIFFCKIKEKFTEEVVEQEQIHASEQIRQQIIDNECIRKRYADLTSLERINQNTKTLRIINNIHNFTFSNLQSIDLPEMPVDEEAEEQTVDALSLAYKCPDLGLQEICQSVDISSLGCYEFATLATNDINLGVTLNYDPNSNLCIVNNCYEGCQRTPLTKQCMVKLEDLVENDDVDEYEYVSVELNPETCIYDAPNENIFETSMDDPSECLQPDDQSFLDSCPPTRYYKVVQDPPLTTAPNYTYTLLAETQEFKQVTGGGYKCDIENEDTYFPDTLPDAQNNACKFARAECRLNQAPWKETREAVHSSGQCIIDNCEEPCNNEPQKTVYCEAGSDPVEYTPNRLDRNHETCQYPSTPGGCYDTLDAITTCPTSPTTKYKIIRDNERKVGNDYFYDIQQTNQTYPTHHIDKVVCNFQNGFNYNDTETTQQCQQMSKICTNGRIHGVREGNQCVIRNCQHCDNPSRKTCYYNRGGGRVEKMTHQLNSVACTYVGGYDQGSCMDNLPDPSTICDGGSPKYYVGFENVISDEAKVEYKIERYSSMLHASDGVNYVCANPDYVQGTTSPDKETVCRSKQKHCFSVATGGETTLTARYVNDINSSYPHGKCVIDDCGDQYLAECDHGDTWTPWSECVTNNTVEILRGSRDSGIIRNVFCESGVQIRKHCSISSEDITQPCNTHTCPIGCQSSTEYSNWSKCSYCGPTGERTRTYCGPGACPEGECRQSCAHLTCPAGCDENTRNSHTPWNQTWQNAVSIGYERINCTTGNTETKTERKPEVSFNFKNIAFDTTNLGYHNGDNYNENAFVITLGNIQETGSYVRHGLLELRIFLLKTIENEGGDGRITIFDSLYKTIASDSTSDRIIIITTKRNVAERVRDNIYRIGPFDFDASSLNTLDECKVRAYIGYNGTTYTFNTFAHRIQQNKLLPINCIGHTELCPSGGNRYIITTHAKFGGTPCEQSETDCPRDASTGKVVFLFADKAIGELPGMVSQSEFYPLEEEKANIRVHPGFPYFNTGFPYVKTRKTGSTYDATINVNTSESVTMPWLVKEHEPWRLDLAEISYPIGYPNMMRTVKKYSTWQMIGNKNYTHNDAYAGFNNSRLTVTGLDPNTYYLWVMLLKDRSFNYGHIVHILFWTKID